MLSSTLSRVSTGSLRTSMFHSKPSITAPSSMTFSRCLSTAMMMKRNVKTSTVATITSLLSTPFILSSSSSSSTQSSSFSTSSLILQQNDFIQYEKAKPTELQIPKGTILVCGGNGALGKAFIYKFKQAGWKTICLDYTSNPESDSNILLSAKKNWRENINAAEAELTKLASSSTFRLSSSSPTSSSSSSPSSPSPTHFIQVMVHVAGSWKGGSILDAKSFLDSIDPMLDINLKSAITTAYLSGQFLDQSGTHGLKQSSLILTGAHAAAEGARIKPTEDMVGYGMSKAATQALAISLGKEVEENEREVKDGRLKHMQVLCIQPTMIDTPSNRQFSKQADKDALNWTKPNEFAEFILNGLAQQYRNNQVAAASANPPSASSATASPVLQQRPQDIPLLRNKGFYTFQTSNGQTNVKAVYLETKESKQEVKEYYLK